MPPYDAILVPGGGLVDHETLPLWVQRRLDRALERYQGETIITLSAGTTYKPPPLDPRGFPVPESIASARYLIARGVAPDRVLPETVSYDTIGNAYFSRVIHVDPSGLRRLLIVTSAFHVARTEAIFRWVYGLLPSTGCELDFEAVSDEGINADALRARIGKEKTGLQQLAAFVPTIADLAHLHRWLYSEHAAYAMPHYFLNEPPPPPEAINTY